MDKLVLIDVDEPESYVLLTAMGKIHYLSTLPKLIDSVLFSVFNNLFDTGTGEEMRIDNMTTLLCINVLMNTPPRGFTFDSSRSQEIIRPLKDVATHLIPALVQLNRFSTFVSLDTAHQRIQITIQNIN